MVSEIFGRRALLTGLVVSGTSLMASPSFAQSREGNARPAPARPAQGRPAQDISEPSILSYEPITQMRARKVKFFRPEERTPGCAPRGGKEENYNWGQLSREEVGELLSNYSQWTTAIRLDASGSASTILPAITGRINRGEYRIIIDFLRYMSQTVYAEDDQRGEVLGRCVVGVGLRTVCDVETFSGSTEATLIALTAKASVNQASGKLRFDSIGIASNEVAALMPTNVSLDESGIVQAAAATAAIRGLMNDPQTTLVPHVIAVQVAEGSEEKREQLLARVMQG